MSEGIWPSLYTSPFGYEAQEVQGTLAMPASIPLH